MGYWFRRPSSGFTLIEMIVVLSLMAVLAGMSVASFSWLNQTTRIRTAAFDLLADLNFARSEAIKRNADVVVAPIGGSWGSGWTVAGGGNTLRQRGAPGGQVALSTTATNVSYDGGGRAALGTATFQLCPAGGGSQSGRTISVAASGLSKSARSDCP